MVQFDGADGGGKEIIFSGKDTSPIIIPNTVVTIIPKSIPPFILFISIIAIMKSPIIETQVVFVKVMHRS